MILKDIVTPAQLRKLAGPQSYERGEAYLARGAVRMLHCTGNEATAIVQGAAAYHVRIRANGKNMQYECDCPFALDTGEICKHLVAVGLALHDASAVAAGTETNAVCRDPWAELDNYLRGLDTGTLADLLLDAARDDRQLRRKLMKMATPVAFDEQALRELIDETMDEVPEYVHWREAGDVALSMEEMLGELLRARTAATAPALVPVLEYAYERLDSIMEQVDDSDGGMGDVLTDIGKAHLETCELARLDPEALAARLFELATRPDMGLWDFGPNAYAAALGEAGLRRYREIVQAAWNALPSTGAESDDAYSISRLMLELAGNDVDLTVDILSRDLGGSHQYRRIAEALRDAGRMEQSVDWARRGLKAFPDRLESALCNMVVEHDLASGNGEQAVSLRLRQLEQSPSLAGYQALAATAQAAGAWPACRDQAWQVLDGGTGKTGGTDRTLQVAIALWENNLGLAMEHAQAGTCAPHQLLDLAIELEAQWPDEAFGTYRRLVRDALEPGRGYSNDAYATAAGHVERIARLLGGLGRAEECAGYLAYLRSEYKRKRNFMKLLDALS